MERIITSHLIFDSTDYETGQHLVMRGGQEVEYEDLTRDEIRELENRSRKIAVELKEIMEERAGDAKFVAEVVAEEKGRQATMRKLGYAQEWELERRMANLEDLVSDLALHNNFSTGKTEIGGEVPMGVHDRLCRLEAETCPIVDAALPGEDDADADAAEDSVDE